MEQEKSLFNLEIESAAKGYLLEAAKWGRFLAIVGFISLGLIILFSAVGIFITPPPPASADPAFKIGYTIGTIVGALLITLIYFFPLLYLLRFSSQIKRALISNDILTMNEAFRNLKNTFRYL